MPALTAKSSGGGRCTRMSRLTQCASAPGDGTPHARRARRRRHAPSRTLAPRFRRPRVSRSRRDLALRTRRPDHLTASESRSRLPASSRTPQASTTPCSARRNRWTGRQSRSRRPGGRARVADSPERRTRRPGSIPQVDCDRGVAYLVAREDIWADVEPVKIIVDIDPQRSKVQLEMCGLGIQQCRHSESVVSPEDCERLWRGYHSDVTLRTTNVLTNSYGSARGEMFRGGKLHAQWIDGDLKHRVALVRENASTLNEAISAEEHDAHAASVQSLIGPRGRARRSAGAGASPKT